uniref:Uncharacterized protein n=1 Tax=viral metagenome TaxID=1070528 RepID=A0A6C0HWZ8_9ZZZZ
MPDQIESFLLSPTSEYDITIPKQVDTTVLDKTKENFIGFVGIKWVAMIYVAIIQIISCLILSKIISKIIPSIKTKDSNPTKPSEPNMYSNDVSDKYDEPTHLTILYSFLNLALILISIYIMRNITQRIPFPLDGTAGYQHSRLREINGVFIANFVLLYYQTSFIDRLKIMFNKI